VGGSRVAGFHDELDGSNFVKRSDGAAGDDGEIGCERGDGNEAEVGPASEQLVGAERRQGVVEGVAVGQSGGEGRVLEVPHEGSGVEEVDGGDAKFGER